MSEGRTIARNAMSSYGARFFLVLSVLLLTPYLFRKLGVAGFGTWSVIYTIGSIFGLIEFGFSAGVTKLVAELRGEGDRRKLEATVGASTALMFAIGVIALLASFAAAFLLDGLAAESDRESFRLAMMLLGLTMAVRLPLTSYGAVLLGYQKADRFNLGETVAAVAFPVGAVVALESDTGIVGVTAAYGASLIAAGLVFGVLLRSTDPRLRLRPTFGDRETRRRIRGFASFTLLADAMMFIGTRMDTIVIAAIRGASSAAPYAAAVKLQSGLQSLTFPIYLLFMPMVSELWGAGRRTEVAERLLLATRVATQVTMPVALALALFSADIVDLWLGAEAPSVTAPIIVLLVSVQAITLSVLPSEKTLIGVGRVRIIGGLAMIEGVANLALSIVLVFAYGPIGAAVATLATYGVLAPVKVPLVARALGITTRRMLKSSFAPAFYSSIAPFAWMGAVWALMPIGPPRLAVGIVGGLGLWVAIGLHQIDIRQLSEMLRSRRGTAAPAEELEAELVER